MATIDHERLLPGSEELETAEYAMGVYLSELDEMRRRVEKELAQMSVSEYVQLVDAGAEEEISGPDVSEAELIELLRFTADALRDADAIKKIASAVQGEILAELHERREFSGGDDPRWLAYRERRRQWHRERAELS